MSKKFLSVLMVCLLVLVFAGCSTPAGDAGEEPETVFINIASGGTAGTYFPLAGGMADIWNKNVEGVNATAQSTGASVANVNMLRNGEVDVIFVQNDVVYYAFNGTESFDGNQYADVRGMTTMYPETIQIVTTAGTGINTVEDLAGKKIAVGAAGSGTEANARQILNAAGITYEDIDEQYLSFAEAASNLKDGNIDAAFITAGFPTAAVQDIAAQHDVVLVEVSKDLADKLMEEYPFYTEIVVPAGTYTGFDKDVATVSVKAMLAVSANMDEDLVYNMLKTLYDNPARLEAAHTKGAMITADTGMDGMSIDLHPGAQRFFDEL